jgi:hypothetical protein
MSRDESRIAAILSELSDLSRRIAERAAELGRLAGDKGAGPPTAGVAATAAALVAAIEPATVRRRADVRSRSAGTAGRSRTSTVSKDRRGGRSQPVPRATGRHPSRHQAERRRRPLMPAIVSTAMHVIVLVGLGLIFVAADAKPERVVITLGATEDQAIDELSPVEFEASAETAEAVESEPAMEPLPELDALVAEPVVVDSAASSESPLDVDPSSVAPTSFDSGDMLAAIGGGGEGEPSGAGRGRGDSATAPAAGTAAFFGRSGQGQSVCFICDNSNSYRDGGFHMVLDEVARSVDALQPGQSFFVIFFSDAAYPMFQPDRLDALQPASPDAKRRLRSWLGTVEMCAGGQGIDEAIELAGSLGAEVVYFLSDGDHAASVVERVGSADLGGAVVHTFGMQRSPIDSRTGMIDPERVRRQQGFDRNLLAIATAHGGTYTPVVVPPQAAALEQMRPIRKNRSRGPVWGLNL